MIRKAVDTLTGLFVPRSFRHDAHDSNKSEPAWQASDATQKAQGSDFLGRFREILSDPVNLLIEREAKAGSVAGNTVHLHNGNVVPLSGRYAYYGRFSEILILNRGVHEPLEEFVFQELLKILATKPLMLELGAYWGHYSMWMKRHRPDATVWMVEPDPHNLEAGRYNFAQNGLEGTFINAFVGRGQFSVADFMEEKQIGKLTVLHCDIQGHEIDMLEGCHELLQRERIDYLFISTHSQDIHQSVCATLNSNRYRVEVSSDYDFETTSYDGMVFASSPGVRPLFGRKLQPFARQQLPGLSVAKLMDSLANGFLACDANGK